MKDIKILDVKITSLREEEVIERMRGMMQKGHSLLCTPNTEFLINAAKDQDFKSILNKDSKINLPDSFGLLWAARFNSLWLPKQSALKQAVIFLQWISTLILIPFFPKYFYQPIHGRISGSDFIWPLARFAAENKFKIFLLGGAPTVAERVALKLQTDIFGLRIAGVHSGSPKDTEEIVEAINRAKADIVIVAFGSPKQEIWLKQNLARTSCRVGIGLGGTFDFIAGVRPRAPLVMRRIGLEWLFRLVIEPSRFRRQLALPKFAWRVLLSRLNSI